MTASARPAAVVAVLATTALLAGCTTGPTPPAALSASAPAPSPALTWPAVPGRVLTASDADGEHVERVAVTDPQAAYERSRALLVAAGYTLTKDREGTGGGDGQACSPATLVCVGFTAASDPRYGPSVRYEVFRSTGVMG